jgi:hypothetical protein
MLSGRYLGTALLCLMLAELALSQTKHAARSDTDYLARHEAMLARFRSTGNLDEMIEYCLQVQAGKVFADVPGDPQTWTAAQKQEQTTKNLFKIGTTVFLARRLEEQPEQVSRCLLKLFQDRQGWKRQAAVRNLALMLSFVTQPAPWWQPQAMPEKKPFDLAPLKKLQVPETLRRLSEQDADPAVRQAARQALIVWQQTLQPPRENLEDSPFGSLFRTPSAPNYRELFDSSGYTTPDDYIKKLRLPKDGTSNTITWPEVGSGDNRIRIEDGSSRFLPTPATLPLPTPPADPKQK